MKNLYIIILLVLITSKNGYTQCSNYVSNYPSGTASTTSNSLTTVSACMYGGEYTYFNVTDGYTYTWTTCGDSDFDTQLTLTQGSSTSGTNLAYNNDDCGVQSTITWTATFTGTVTLLVSQHDCSSNTTCMTVQWACTSCAAPPPAGCIGGSNNTCAAADPFCTGTSYNYCNTTGVASMGDYQCLNSTPNPMWMYLQISTSGNIDIFIEQYKNNGDDIDVDFALYGPYTNFASACPAINESTATVDCSFSAASTETANITNAVAGQWYIMLITNYNGAAGYIQFSQTGGSGATNCDIIDPCKSKATKTNPICNGGTGSILIAATNGAQPYNISWSGTSSGNPGGNEIDSTAETYTIPSLAAGNYVVTITDAATCSTTQNITLTEPAAITATYATTNMSCFGTCNGSIIQTSVAGGSPGYTYHWGGGQTSTSLTGLCAGAYALTITDAYSCTFTGSYTITEPLALVLGLTNTEATCDEANGTITETVTNGTANFSYSGSGPTNFGPTSAGTPNTQTGLLPGNYTVTLTDAHGCTASATTTIANGGTVVAVFTTSTNQCLSGNNFTFNASTSTIISAPTYSWDFGDGNTGTGVNTTHTYAAAGTYIVTLTLTDSPCSDTETHTVIVYPQPTATASVVSNVTCNGLANGQAAATGGGTYTWSNGNTGTPTAATLAAGPYTVTVASSFGCTNTASVTITQPQALAITVAVNPTTCNGTSDGQAVCTITTPSTSPYDYQWSNLSSTMNSASLTNTVNTFAAASYTITVTDANGCTKDMNFTITQPAAWDITYVVTNASCGSANGAINLSVNAGNTPPYHFNWSNAATTEDLNSILAGPYTVTVSDNTTCTSVVAVSVIDAGAPVIDITAFANPTCNGGTNGTASASLTTTSTGPYTYVWSSGTGTPIGASALTTTSVTGLGDGTFTVQVTDASGCIASDNVVLTQPTAIIVTLDNVTPANCGQNDGTISTSVSGGTPTYTYSWNTTPTQSVQDPTNVAAGTYSVIVTDANTCTGTLTNVTIIDNPSPIISATVLTNPSCTGICDATGQVTITTPTTAPYDYDWDNGLTDNLATTSLTDDVNGLCATNTYNVTVTDANGCTATTNIKPTDPTPVVAAATFTNVNCFGGNTGSGTATAHGGTPNYNYSWNGGTTPNNDYTTGLIAGTYTVTATDANGCTDDVSITITEPAQLNISVTAHTDETCGLNNGQITVSATGGTTNYNYLWDTNALNSTNTTVTNLTGGTTYWVTVTDANNCTASTNQNLTDIPAGIATISGTTDITCFGDNDGSATVSIAGGTMPFNYVWSNGYILNNSNTASNTATGLSQGVVSVNITDANSCLITASTTINEPAQLTNTFTVDVLECNSYCDAGIITNVAGGITNYTYSWNTVPVQTTSSISGLCAGNYIVTITDHNHCTITDNVTITDPPAMVLSAVSTNSSCNQSDGSINLTVTNQLLPMSYSWTGPLGFTSSSEDISAIPAGTYYVTVTNGNNCTTSGNWVVIDDSGPSATITASGNVTCFGDNNGFATVDATGGTGAGTYTYLWNNATATASATNLDGGTYTVTVTDANGCQATASVVITEPPYLNFTLNKHDPLCSGGTDGWASVTPYGGTAPYTYSWTGTGTNPNDSLFTNLADGLYSVQITDANGCDTILNNIHIIEPPTMSATSSITNVLCYGQNNGSITLNVIGGTTATGLYNYVWSSNSGSQTTNPANSLLAGNYTVTIKDDNNCTITYSATIAEPTELIISNVTPTNLSCFQSNDGTINITTTGGTAGYGYYWEVGTNPGTQFSINEDLGNIESNTYFVTVTDQHNCTVSTSVIITQPLPLTLSMSSTDETCYNYCDGSINTIVTGGTQISGSYNFLWTNNAITQNLANVCPNTYSLVVTDAHGCTISGSETITGAPQLYLTITNVTEATCGGSNGEITIAIGGGTGVPTIDWTPSVNIANPANVGNSHVISLPANNYYVEITDGNGCQIDTSISVNNIGGPILDAVVTTNATCFGDCDGSITLTYHQPTPSAPPYTLTWLGYPAYTNINTLDNRCAGTYYWVVTDVNGCQISGSAVVTEPTNLTSTFMSSNNVTCNGVCNGSATVNVNGGTAPYSYVWTDGVNNTSTGNNLCAGTHNVQITDAHGCTTQSNVSITQPAPLAINTDFIEDVSCYGYTDGVVCILGQGGSGTYYYQWYGQGTTSIVSCASGLTAGLSYTISLTDQNDVNCSVTQEYIINQPHLLEVFTSSIPTHCNGANGQAIIDNINGGTPQYNINWSPCPSPSGCGGYTLNNLTNSVYQVQVTDANGCTAVSQIQVNDKPVPYLFDAQSTDAICNGSSDGCAMVTIKNGERPFIYDWIPYGGSNQDSTTCNLSAGNYNVVVTDADGCTVTTVFTIDQPDPIVVFADGPSTPVCIGQMTYITANANGGTPQYTYFWNDPTLHGNNVTVYPHQGTSYSVYVTDANGCTSNSSQVNIQVYPSIHVIASPDQTICYGESTSITATATGGNGSSYTYNWVPVNGNTNATVSVSPITTTTYYVSAQDLCHSPSDTATTTVNIAFTPQILSVNGGEGCEPLDVNFSVLLVDTSMAVTYNWGFENLNSHLENPTHTYNNAGIYNVSLELTSINGCKLDTILNNLVKVYPLPDAVLSSDKQVVSIFNSEVEFTDNSDGYGYTLSNAWNFGDSTIAEGVNRVIHIYEHPGYFNVTLYVTNQYGCSDSTFTTIRVEQEHTFYMANAFRPNIDKWYYPKGIGIETKNYKFTIYNRWGEIIFETSDYPEGTDKVDRLGDIEGGWNGKFKNTGKYVQDDVYVWLVEILDVNGYMHEYSGIVNVIR